MELKAITTTLLVGAVAPMLHAAERPNVLFIFADDLSIDAINSRNSDVITPNIDRLSASGTLFTHAFNQGAWSGAVSAASRMMLATGVNLWRAFEFTKSDKLLTEGDGCRLWSEYMSDAGYDTYFTGKWHVSAAKSSDVFDVARNERGGMPNQSDEGYAFSAKNPNGRKFIKGVEDAWQPYDTSYDGYWKGGKHWSEIVKDDALDYIEMAKDDDDPFFMYIAFNAPHDPRQAPKEYVDMYDATRLAVPESLLPEYPYKDLIGCSERLRDEMLAPFPRTEYSIQVNRRDYYALITHLDAKIGEIIEALERSGKMDNTYIIFTADHGISIGEHGLVGKQNMYDPAMSTPLIVSGPGVKRGEVCSELIYLQDAMATALDIAESEALYRVDFKSLLPLAEGRGKSLNSAIYGGYMGLQRMIRTKHYKMIIYPTADVVRLYDMERDPKEMYDLAREPKYRRCMDKLFKEFMSLQIETGDTLDVTKSYNAFFESLQ